MKAKIFTLIFVLFCLNSIAQTNSKNKKSAPKKLYIIVEGLLISTKDFESDWNGAIDFCQKTLGGYYDGNTSTYHGWRLPTRDELEWMYRNQNLVGNFSNNLYWSSTNDKNYTFGKFALNPQNGKFESIRHYISYGNGNKNPVNYFRPVRSANE